MEQWGQSQQPQQPQSQQQWAPPTAGQQSNRRAWWIVTAVVLALALLVMIAYFVLGAKNDNAAAPVASSAAPEQQTVTVKEQPPVTVTETVEPPVTVTDRTTVRQTVPQRSNSNNWAGLMNSQTSCAAPEYAGTNGVDYISVCRGNTGRDYHAWVNGKSLDLSGRTVRNGYADYSIDANPNSIEIDGSHVTVYDGAGAIAYELDLDHWTAA
ncbi:hypothetical protein [Corynebacterium gerontici]|uniref:Uncharacterized protein n=1 Tax=Corynebacterium gerontici TaxID=2079234 RepID=A0A3G6J2J4_9CORY|nr:hypothetical protein [Corynebacterium gerontici]AZA12169.1 hypothetical protein CGERO_09390 [Corynebacterium gerontici]